MFRTRLPVASICIATDLLPLDLHVLSLPLAFILSQDQTRLPRAVGCRRARQAPSIAYCPAAQDLFAPRLSQIASGDADSNEAIGSGLLPW